MSGSKFAITIHSHDTVESRTFTLPNSSPISRGVALAQHPTDPDSAVLANNDRAFIGFLTREVTTDGPTLADSVYPGRIETPFKSGGAVGIDSGALEIEAESADVVMTSGGRAVDGNTEVGSLLSFQDGRIALASSGKAAQFILAAQLPAVESVNQFRIRARYIGAAKA